LDIGQYDLIIGRPTIKQYHLEKHSLSRTAYNDEQPVSGGRSHDRSPNSQHLWALQFRRSPKGDFLDPETDSDGEEEAAPIGELPTYNTQSDTDLSLITIRGSVEEIQRIQTLCEEFTDIFSSSVRPQPADLKPMEVEVDESKWKVAKHRGPPRTQTREKQHEILEQIETLGRHGIIQPSQATEYSQVHLTPKPNGKWRFCLDYRQLNEVSKSLGWPIPNIQLMLDRLGAIGAKYFGIMDLTSGYHQAPLSQMSRHLTAFITHMGVFEWTRIPMGLKGAPSFFQSEMANTVLAGLIYRICEAYLDDILVYGRTFNEYIDNLTAVFHRFRKHNLTLNPSKCKFGLQEIEFVGHVINGHGITFSEEKRAKVMQVSAPLQHRHMKSFLGLANYFRNHIRDHSTLVHPLNALIVQYDKTKFIQWNPEAQEAFEKIKVAINDCPTLFFMDSHAPIFLYTDASQYGIGGYLFQVVDGNERPVSFVSQSLSKNQIDKWSTPEKECYAIFYSLKKLEYLIRDTHFTLRTDHKNLIYLNLEASAKN
jgi:hypothetical protein